MSSPVTVAIILNLSNTYGLHDDIIVIERLLKSQKLPFVIQKPSIRDIRQPHTHHDIQFHLEIPCYNAIPWAHTNVMLVNPEQWSYSYDAYIHAFDALLFRDSTSLEHFRVDLEKRGIVANHLYVIPWCSSWQLKDVQPFYSPANCLNEFVCFLGGSTTKFEYNSKVLPLWKETDPRLTVYTARKDHADSLKKLKLSKNISIIHQNLDLNRQVVLANSYHGHLICSQGEGFGYAAANAEMCGAFAIMNRVPAFEYAYSNGVPGVPGSNGVAWLSNSYDASNTVRYNNASPSATIREELDLTFQQFLSADLNIIHAERQAIAAQRFKNTADAFLPVLSMLCELVVARKPSKGIFYCPPILTIEDCPSISIITPTYNRKKLIDIAFHNLLATDYPHNKIEWVVIEDNENPLNMANEKIIDFQVQTPSIAIKYIPIEGRMSIGEKRNHAIEHSTHDIILFMDDDDHYPVTSFRRRVAWLTKGVKGGEVNHTIACCTTLALYDLTRGISAVNVPPFDIPFSQRISEATLTFKRSAWLERKFSNVSISEGENWIEGRENQVIEMQPQQIIVAFSHGNNQSSRRVPPTDTIPSCFWGFPKEYLIFIHGLVGVEIEEQKDSTKKFTKNSKDK